MVSAVYSESYTTCSHEGVQEIVSETIDGPVVTYISVYAEPDLLRSKEVTFSSN